MAKKRVLLIEDDEFLSQGYIFFLKNAGFDVTYAPDAEEGLLYLGKNTKKLPDIILLDLIMPGMNGFEMLETLKKNKTFRDVPVIIVSNLGQDSDILECKRLGAADFIIKSNLSMTDVVAKINTFLKK